MIPRDRLLALVNARTQAPDPARPVRVPYPRPAEALYASPNKDGTRKRCGNCYKFVGIGACIEVAGEIDAGQVCGLHLFGTPQPALPAVGVPAAKYSPVGAGLVDTPDSQGAACDRCRFFTPDLRDSTVGLCGALGSIDGEPPVIADALGCCARWQASPVPIT